MTTILSPRAGRSLADAGSLADFEGVASRVGVRRLVTQATSASGTDQIAAVAVVRNPWLGTGPHADLAGETRRVAPVVAKLLTDRIVAAAGGADRVEAFGKAAVVGLAGEYEHGGALIHTPYFGNLVREALEGTSVLCFVDGMAEAGESIRVPMWHKTEATTRSHYQSLAVALADAPRRDEIAVIVAASTGPRPHARIGDRRTDQPITSDILKEIPL